MKRFLAIALLIVATTTAHAEIEKVWYCGDGVRIKRTDLSHPLSSGGGANLRWNGTSVNLWGGRGEVVAFQAQIVGGDVTTSNVNVTLDSLHKSTAPTFTIKNTGSAPQLANPYWYVGKRIEMYVMHSMNIVDRTNISYNGFSTSRPGFQPLDIFYTDSDFMGFQPEICVPFQATAGAKTHGQGGAPFSVTAKQNQAIWVDISIPTNAEKGDYTGTLKVTVNGTTMFTTTINLRVYNYTLPNEINLRHAASFEADNSEFESTLGLNSNTQPELFWARVREAYAFCMRHRLNLSIWSIDTTTFRTKLLPVYNGKYFTSDSGYEGPSYGVGPNLAQFGSYQLPNHYPGIGIKINNTGVRARDSLQINMYKLPGSKRGQWSASSVSYLLGDRVWVSGVGAYFCRQAHTSNGSNGPPNSTFWYSLYKADYTRFADGDPNAIAWHPSGEHWVSGRSYVINQIVRDTSAYPYLFWVTAPHTASSTNRPQGSTASPSHTAWRFWSPLYDRGSGTGFAFDADSNQQKENWETAADWWYDMFQQHAPNSIFRVYGPEEVNVENGYSDTSAYFVIARFTRWLNQNPSGKILKMRIATKNEGNTTFTARMAADVLYSGPGSVGFGAFNIDTAAASKARGKTVGLYTDGTWPHWGVMVIDAPAFYYQSWGWLLWKYRDIISEFSIWRTFTKQDDPSVDGWWDADRRQVEDKRYYGDGGFLYTGKQRSPWTGDSRGLDGLLASVRLKNWRKGEQEYEKLRLASQNPELASAIQAIVDSMVPRAFNLEPASNNPSPRWAQDQAEYDWASLAVAQLLESGAALRSNVRTVWAIQDGEKIDKKNIIHPAKSGKDNSVWNGSRVSIESGKNETVAFQLQIEAGDIAATGVSVRLPSLTSGSRTISNSGWSGNLNDLRGQRIMLYREHYITVNTRSNSTLWWPLSAKPTPDSEFLGLIPDPLIPSQSVKGLPFNIAANENQGVWFDISVPDTQMAGTYTGNIEVLENNRVTWTIPCTLKVRNMRLPDTTHTKNAFFVGTEYGLEYPGSASLFSENYYQRMDDLVRAGHARRMHFVQGRSDTSIFRIREKKYYVSGAGSFFTAANLYEGAGEQVPNTMLPIGTGLTPHGLSTIGMGTYTGKDVASGSIQADDIYQNAGYTSVTYRGVTYANGRCFVGVEGDKEYTRTGSGMVVKVSDESSIAIGSTSWQNILQNELDNSVLAYLWNVDYQNETDTSQFSLSNIVWDYVRHQATEGQDLPLWGNPSAIFPSQIGKINYWALTGRSSEDKFGTPGGYEIAPANARRLAGDKVGIYDGTRPSFGQIFALDAKAIEPRTIPWIMDFYDVDFYYCSNVAKIYDADTLDPWVSQYVDGKNGDGMLIYVGNDESTPHSPGLNAPIFGIRANNWRRGAQDAEIMWLARQMGRGGLVDSLFRSVIQVAFDDSISESVNLDPSVKRNAYWSGNSYLYDQAINFLRTTIEAGGVALPTGTFSTSATSVTSCGGPVTLTWTSSGATGASISGIGTVATSGSMIVNIFQTTAYTLSLTNASGTTTYSVSIVVQAPQSNMLSNTDFETGTNSWSFFSNGSGSSFSADTLAPRYQGAKHGKVVIGTVAGNNMQLYQQNLSVETGATYKVSFAGYSNTGRDIKLDVLKQVSPNNSYGLSNYNIDLKREWGAHSVTFVATGTSDSVRFRFKFNGTALAGDVYYFDNVSIVKLTVPCKPGLNKPDSAATNQNTATKLEWFPAAEAEWYRIQVSTVSNFASLVSDDSVTATQITKSLEMSTTYYWRVRALNTIGQSSYSNTWSFTTTAGVPGSVTQTAPADSATQVSISPLFQWTTTTGVSTYHLQLALDPAFVALLLNDSTIILNMRTVGGLASKTRYYWRVRAKNNIGAGAWSATRTFVTTNPRKRQIVIGTR